MNISSIVSIIINRIEIFFNDFNRINKCSLIYHLWQKNHLNFLVTEFIILIVTFLFICIIIYVNKIHTKFPQLTCNKIN